MLDKSLNPQGIFVNIDNSHASQLSLTSAQIPKGSNTLPEPSSAIESANASHFQKGGKINKKKFNKISAKYKKIKSKKTLRKKAKQVKNKLLRMSNKLRKTYKKQ